MIREIPLIAQLSASSLTDNFKGAFPRRQHLVDNRRLCNLRGGRRTGAEGRPASCSSSRRGPSSCTAPCRTGTQGLFPGNDCIELVGHQQQVVPDWARAAQDRQQLEGRPGYARPLVGSSSNQHPLDRAPGPGPAAAARRWAVRSSWQVGAFGQIASPEWSSASPHPQACGGLWSAEARAECPPSRRKRRATTSRASTPPRVALQILGDEPDRRPQSKRIAV